MWILTYFSCARAGGSMIIEWSVIYAGCDCVFSTPSTPILGWYITERHPTQYFVFYHQPNFCSPTNTHQTHFIRQCLKQLPLSDDHSRSFLSEVLTLKSLSSSLLRNSPPCCTLELSDDSLEASAPSTSDSSRSSELPRLLLAPTKSPLSSRPTCET